MVSPEVYMQTGANEESWIFYFNNNPLIAPQGDPVVERALERATQILTHLTDDEFPEIQSTAGPGNLSRAVFELGLAYPDEHQVQVLADWESIATSRWPLSYRADARNWRLSNGKPFQT